MNESGVETIYNYRRLDARIATAGQPTEAELAGVAAEGYEVVINLAPHESKQALPDERQTVETLGMAYETIPVDWENPTRADLDAFFQAMERHVDRRVFVHCAANMRVSAFMMVYRVLRLGWKVEDALPDLHALWAPTARWLDFIDTALKEGV